MKKNILMVAAVMGLLATACNKEDLNPQGELMQTSISIKASYGNSNGTKVTYTESGDNINATWQSGDKLLVVYDGKVSTLTLNSGAGSATATFTGTLNYTEGHAPNAYSLLNCYVWDENNTGAITVDGDNLTFSNSAFTSQDGSLATAAKCNLWRGYVEYGDGSNLNCTFNVSTSMCKFNISAPAIAAGATASLTYKSGSTTLAEATFTVGTSGANTVYLAVPAGRYTGEQTLVYTYGAGSETHELSASQASFAAGQTYSKAVTYKSIPVIGHYLNKDGSITSTKQTSGDDESYAVIAYAGAISSYCDNFLAIALNDCCYIDRTEDYGVVFSTAATNVGTYAAAHPITLNGTAYNTNALGSDCYDVVASSFYSPSKTRTGDVVKGWRIPSITDWRYIVYGLCNSGNPTNPSYVYDLRSEDGAYGKMNEINDVINNACGNTEFDMKHYHTSSELNGNNSKSWKYWVGTNCSFAYDDKEGANYKAHVRAIFAH